MTKYNLELLTRLKKDFTGDMEENIISDLIEHGEDWYSYLQDVLNHGCVSGIVKGLIYYHDTANFHDKYEDEIDELIELYADENDIEFVELAGSKIDLWDIQQLKNWKAWFAYEETIHRISNWIESEA